MSNIKKAAFVVILVGVIVGGALYLDKNKNSPSTSEPNPYANSLIETKTFQNEDSTWGYDVLIDGHIYVHQPSVPAVGGSAGFTSEADAKKVALLVVSKIKQNILPPSVTPEELKELGV